MNTLKNNLVTSDLLTTRNMESPTTQDGPFWDRTNSNPAQSTLANGKTAKSTVEENLPGKTVPCTRANGSAICPTAKEG